MKLKFIVLFVIVLLFIPSLMFGGEWEINGQLSQRISDGAQILKLSQETCDLLGCDNLVWVGGGNAPGTGNATNYWAIYNMFNGECLYQGNMLDARGYFSVVEITNNRLLIISGVNQSGEIGNCEILNLPALIETSLTLSVPTDDANPSSGSSAIVLNNNNVLYGGGGQSDGNKWQIFDINTEIWSLIFYSIIERHDFELQLDPNSDNVIAIAGNPSYGEIEIFEPVATEWTLGPEIPHPVYWAKTEVVSNYEIALTGGYAWGEYSNQTVLYHTITNEITVLDSFDLGRRMHGSVWIEPANKLFIGGGSVSPENGWATKTCYSYQLPSGIWADETDQPGYMSWCNYFMTDDYKVFMIGNANSGYLALYSWNHAPYLIDYSYASTSTPPTADISVEVHDPDLDSVAVKFIFIENGDSTETTWSEFKPSGSSFDIVHTWSDSVTIKTVICSIRDEHEPCGVHNAIADSILLPNVSVDPEPEKVQLHLYPNPFVTSMTIELHLTKTKLEDTAITIYNIRGERVKELSPQISSCDDLLEVTWDGRNEQGKKVGTGIYVIRANNGNEDIMRKVAVMR